MSADHSPADDKTTDLLSRAVDGDRMAVGELLYQYTDDLRAFVGQRLPNVVRPAVDVDDVLQETFARAFRDMGRFQGTEPAAFAAWLRTIAANRIVDLVRAHTRKKRGGGHQKIARWPMETDAMLELYDVLAGTDSTPLRQASRAEAQRLMHVVLADLPPDYRDVIRLRFFEKLECREIAKRLDRTPNAVQGLLRRAKSQLKDALGRASSYLSSR